MPRPCIEQLHAESPWLDAFEALLGGRRSSSLAVERGERSGGLGIREAVVRDDVAIFVAVVAGRAVGYAVCADSPVRGLLGRGGLAVEELYVSAAPEGDTIRRALLLTIAQHADRCGLVEVLYRVPTRERETNRSLARLGFAPLATVRAAATGGLVRTLAGERADSRLATLRQRRMLRSRHGAAR